MRAFLTVRPQPWYRRDAFEKGLKAAGYDVQLRGPDKARPGDLLVQWNRYGSNHAEASGFERDGGAVLVCENGYINADGSSPKFSVHPGGPKSTDYYAIGIGFHNDADRVLGSGPERLAKLGVELKPWRTDGDYVLVCPNRSFGVPGRMMLPDWADRVALRIRKTTKRPVRIRTHPGNDAPQRPLSEDLKSAWLVVVWTSSSGVHALANGIPVICEAPHWILKGASSGGEIDCPDYPDRLPHFQRLAWGQWQMQEIERGEPFVVIRDRCIRAAREA